MAETSEAPGGTTPPAADPVIKSADDIISAGRLHLSAKLASEIADEKERQAAQDKAVALFTTGIRNEFKGPVAEQGMTRSEAEALAVRVYGAQKEGKEDDKAILQGMSGAIMTLANGKLDQAEAAAIERGAKAAAVFGNTSYATDAKNAIEQGVGKAAAPKMLEMLKTSLDTGSKATADITKDTVELERLIKSVGEEKITAMGEQAKSFFGGAEFKTAIDARLAVVNEVEKQAADAKAAGGADKFSKEVNEANTKALNAAKEAANKAEEAATKAYDALADGYKGNADQKAAFARVSQEAATNALKGDATLQENWKKIAGSKEKVNLGAVGGMLGTDSLTKAGIQTEFAKDNNVAADKGEGSGTAMRAALGIAGVAAAGLAVKAATGDRPVNQETGQKEGMSIGGKIMTALGALGGAALIVMAARGGNFKGFSAPEAESWTQKITAGARGMKIIPQAGASR